MQSLKDIAVISSGAPAGLVQADLQPLNEFQEVPAGGALYVTATDFDSAGFYIQGQGRVAWMDLHSLERYEADARHDVLYVTKGADLRPCLVPQQLDYPIFPSNSLARIRILSDEVLPVYLFTYLCSSTARRFGESRVMDNLTANLSLKDVADMPIPIPELRTQRLIIRLTELQQRQARLNHTLQEDTAALSRGVLQTILRTLTH